MAAVVAVLSALPTLHGGARAEGGDDKSLDKSLDAALRDVINQGAAMFNNQADFAGCYRLYEGALMAVRPALGKYPELQKAIDRAIKEANALSRMHDRAHALRKVLDEVRANLNPGSVPPPKNLWDNLGGEAGVTKVVNELMLAASMDPKVNFDRNGKYPLDKQKAAQLAKSLVDFISQATGGPYKYTGLNMKDAHQGMGITDAEFDALGGHIKKILEKNAVKAADLKTIMGAIEGLRKNIVEPKKGKDKKVDQPDPNMAVLHGKVILKGKPLNYGFVTFVDIDGRAFSANIQKDGIYVFKKGFPPGQYKVLIEGSPTPPEPDEVRTPIPKVYQSLMTTPLRLEAQKGQAEQNIDLQ
jgi:truncated hemoglobin YjbI